MPVTHQRRFTTQELIYSDPTTDCWLDPNDPIHDLMGHAPKGHLQRSAEPHFAQRQQAQTMNIRPGTPAWFAMTQADSK